jgi:hypothetical protein
MSEEQLATFRTFVSPMYEMTISHIWQGFGSAIFLEAGTLIASTDIRRDGTQCSPKGEMSIMIQWDWRIENETNILTGSSSDETERLRFFDQILGSQVTSLTLFARLPEIQIGFSNGLYLCSLMTYPSDPDWAVFDRRHAGVKSVGVREGCLHFENEMTGHEL